MNFFISDIHFCDTTTFLEDNRPFKNITHYDKFMLKNLNKYVGKNDTLYILGDLMDCDNEKSRFWEKSAKYIKKIKGNIVLIMGNNEKRIVNFFFNGNFEKFKTYCKSIGIDDVKYEDYISFGGYDFYLTHEPINYKKGFVTLFGHIHRSKGLWQSFGLNMSCDINHYRPYSEKDILFQLKEKEIYWNSDENLRLL